MIKCVCDMCGKEDNARKFITVNFNKPFGFIGTSDKHLCDECYKKLQNEILNYNKEK